MSIPRNQVRVDGLNKAAAALGCSAVHLSYVLRGQRVSPKLVKRYALLREGKLTKEQKEKD